MTANTNTQGTNMSTPEHNTATPAERPRGTRIKGHKLAMTWSGETARDETSSTGECPCGWTESGSNQEVVKEEYAHHLDHVWRKPQRVWAGLDALQQSALVNYHERKASASDVTQVVELRRQKLLVGGYTLTELGIQVARCAPEGTV